MWHTYWIDDNGNILTCFPAGAGKSPPEGLRAVEVFGYFEPVKHVYNFKLEKIVPRSDDIVAARKRAIIEAAAARLEQEQKKKEALREAMSKLRPGPTKDAFDALLAVLEIE